MNARRRLDCNHQKVKLVVKMTFQDLFMGAVRVERGERLLRKFIHWERRARVENTQVDTVRHRRDEAWTFRYLSGSS
ncbi:hypothetical protein JTE90_022485 [Oedothorax gibbosus]|uniref:Uncharacterized protein n=1 Tax=Oedothorax gibbosus TaxID=931172 RepID=A0AAV6UZ54_9ARAC|nr:hypothetical protein JTE90_022485 [Oedothorax gibbosus]